MTTPKDQLYTGEVTNVEDHVSNKTVTVKIAKPKITPQHSVEMRARARALVAVGVLSTIEELSGNITDPELQRIATVKSNIKINEVGPITEYREITVRVRN